MEYNKKLYDALNKVVLKHNELNKELEQDGISLERMTQINKQLKQSSKIVELFNVYKKYIDDGIEAEQILNTEKIYLGYYSTLQYLKNIFQAAY